MNSKKISASHKRSRLELYLAILEAIVVDVEKKPTRIMYKTNLSWIPLKEILSSMVEQGLITKEEHENRVQYEATGKGLNVLHYFDKIKELIAIKP